MSTEPVDDMWFTLGGNSVNRQAFNDGGWVALAAGILEIVARVRLGTEREEH